MSPKNSKQQSTGDPASRNMISTTRVCIIALRPIIAAVPFGTSVQALLDIGVAVIDKIEQIRAWEAGKMDLCRKIGHVFSMVRTVLNHPYVSQTPDLLDDLHRIITILQEIEEFVGKRTKSKGRRFLKFMLSNPDYERIVEFGSKFDEAVKTLTMKSAMQLRLDIQTLRNTVESSADEVKDTLRTASDGCLKALRSSTEHLKQSFQSSTESLRETVRSSAGNMKEALQLSTEKAERTLESIKSAVSQLVSQASAENDRGKCAECRTAFDARRTDMLAPINGRYRGPALVKESTRDEEPGGKSYAVVLAARAIEGCFYLSPLLSIAAVYAKKEYPHRTVALEGRFFSHI